MIHRDRLAGLPKWRPTRRQVGRSLAIALLGLAAGPGMALGSEVTPDGSGAPAGAAPAEAVARRYVVVRGDTLRAIAARYETTVTALLALNPELAVNPNLLYPGQSVLLPAAPQPTAAPSATSGGSGGSAASAPSVSIDLPAGLAAFQSKFLSASIQPARDSMADTGVPASVTLAQAIIESDWGRSRLSTDGKNYFGIKASSKAGPAGVIWMNTYEAGIGYVNAPFRAYNTMLESFVDHGHFFTENARYAAAMAVKDDARAFARAIHRAGYATAPNYADALIAVMVKFGLEKYDRGAVTSSGTPIAD